MFCDKCGKEIKEGNTFCTNCGAGIIKNETKSDKKTISISLNKLVVIILISLVLVILLTFIILNQKKNISINNNTNTTDNEIKMEEEIIDLSNEENTILLDEIKAKYPTESESICSDGDNYWLLSADGDKVYFTDLESFEMAMETCFNIEHEDERNNNNSETNSKWLSDDEYYKKAVEYLKEKVNFIFSTTIPGAYHETKTSLINIDKNEDKQEVIVTVGLVNILSSSGGYTSSNYEFDVKLDINGDNQRLANSNSDDTNTSSKNTNIIEKSNDNYSNFKSDNSNVKEENYKQTEVKQEDPTISLADINVENKTFAEIKSEIEKRGLKVKKEEENQTVSVFDYPKNPEYTIVGYQFKKGDTVTVREINYSTEGLEMSFAVSSGTYYLNSNKSEYGVKVYFNDELVYTGNDEFTYVFKRNEDIKIKVIAPYTDDSSNVIVIDRTITLKELYEKWSSGLYSINNAMYLSFLK